MYLPGTRAKVLDDHRAIVAALKLRDPEAAQQAMHAHPNHVEQKLKQLLLVEEPAASSLEVD